jgi:hypothetical protein
MADGYYYGKLFPADGAHDTGAADSTSWSRAAPACAGRPIAQGAGLRRVQAKRASAAWDMRQARVKGCAAYMYGYRPSQ